MLLIRTQNKAILNITNFKTISVDIDENDQAVILCDNYYVLGYYDKSEAMEVLNWIAEDISEDATLEMPMSKFISKEDNKNAKKL